MIKFAWYSITVLLLLYLSYVFILFSLLYVNLLRINRGHIKKPFLRENTFLLNILFYYYYIIYYMPELGTNEEIIAVGQWSRTYGLQAPCGSFQNCIWLSALQANLSRLSSKHGKQQIPPKGFWKLPLVLSSASVYPKLPSFCGIRRFCGPKPHHCQLSGSHKKPFSNWGFHGSLSEKGSQPLL